MKRPHSAILPTGIDNDPRRFHKRRAAPHRHRAFGRNQPHNRRFPIGIGPCPIHRGSQTEWEVRYGGRVQDWRNPRFVVFFFFSGNSSSFLLETLFLLRDLVPRHFRICFRHTREVFPLFFFSFSFLPSDRLFLVRSTDPISCAAVLHYLLKSKLIDGDTLTVTGKTLGENLERWVHQRGELSMTSQDVIRPLEKPIKSTGHLR